MSKTSIEQMFGFVKGENQIPERIFFALGKRAKNAEYAVAAQILRESPEKAKDFMQMLGYSGTFPVKLESLAGFYGVSSSYIANVLITLKVGVKTTPTVLWRNEDGEICIDPRLALGLSLIMLHGKTVPQFRYAREMSKRVMTSSYREAINKPEPVEESDETPEVELSSDGRYIIAPDFFATLVSRIAKETVEQIMNHPAAEPEPVVKPVMAVGKKTGRPLKRPENWDDVMADFREGKCNAIQAAKRAGVSCGSFYKYGVRGHAFAADC